jgi:hypothetical protein
VFEKSRFSPSEWAARRLLEDQLQGGLRALLRCEFPVLVVIAEDDPLVAHALGDLAELVPQRAPERRAALPQLSPGCGRPVPRRRGAPAAPQLPSVGLGRFAAGTWKNLVQLFKSCFIQRDFRGVQGALQLLDGSGADYGRSHDGVVQKPSQGHGGGRFAQSLEPTCSILESTMPRSCSR